MARAIKEILCISHSHLDVGFTHPQSMLLNLQEDYIDQALELCERTADYPEPARFRWTCEASLPVERWLQTAAPEQVAWFRRLVQEGRISITALPMHTTPNATTSQAVEVLQRLDALRAATGSAVTCAISHDVNGQPWTLAPLLLDAGVDFYLTGVNIHMGGVPLPRPRAFYWQTPDGRALPSFAGEHYSLFSQFFFTNENSTEKMHQGVQDYVQRIAATTDWDYDFLVLTATNPPLYDNNNPDWNLPDLIARYNAEGHEQTIRFATPEMLWERIRAAGLDRLQTYRGDWTDYWNFGSGSTARETAINRRAGRLLQISDTLAALTVGDTARDKAVRARAYHHARLFDEHTWDAAESVKQPDREECTAQLITKKSYAYAAADNAAYLLSRQVERLAGNPPQSERLAGVVLANPHPFPVWQEVRVPPAYLQAGRTIAAQRAKDMLPYDRTGREEQALGWAQVPPYSVKTVPFAALQPETAVPVRQGDTLQTPFYTVRLEEGSGRIRQITHRETGRELLDETSPWGFFEPVRERVDGTKAPVDRRTIFPRDVDLGNRSISQWVTDWPAVYRGIDEISGAETVCENGNLILTYTLRAFDWTACRQRIIFSVKHDRIRLELDFVKPEDTEPQAVYCALPLKLSAGWQCMFDTADTFVRLDDDQLPTVCRDWVTVDKTVSVFDAGGGVTLACPDAPLVQVGGFGFGRERHRIPRQENPLLLAWLMNNYWDVNFAPSQSGRHILCYELSAFSRFTPQAAYRAGVLAAGGCVQGCAEQADEPAVDTWLTCDSTAAYPVLIRPRADGRVLIGIKNFEDVPARVTLTDPTGQIRAAAVTDLQGHVRQPLLLENGGFTVSLQPNALLFVTVERGK